MKPAATALLVAFLFFAHAPSARASEDALARGSRLCLYPVSLPLAESEGDERQQMLQTKLIEGLARLSIRVADPVELQERTEEFFEASPGVVDPYTGERLSQAYDARRAALSRILQDEFGCDAQLFAKVVVVTASFRNYTAAWDGVKRSLSDDSGFKQFLLGEAQQGWMAALSLWLEVVDFAGETIAFRSAGIEPLVRREVWVGNDLVPEDAWLTKHEYIDDAIASALGPDGSRLRERGTASSLPEFIEDPLRTHR